MVYTAADARSNYTIQGKLATVEEIIAIVDDLLQRPAEGVVSYSQIHGRLVFQISGAAIDERLDAGTVAESDDWVFNTVLKPAYEPAGWEITWKPSARIFYMEAVPTK